MKNKNHTLYHIDGGLATKYTKNKLPKPSATYSNVIEDVRETSKNLHSYQINDYFSSFFGVEYKKRPSNGGIEIDDSTNQKGGKYMDDGYKKLIDRLDQDMRDHKQEIRDRDSRLQSEMQEREERTIRDAKEREERILNSITILGNQLDSKMNQIEQSIQRSESRIDATATHVQAMVTQNFWGRIATVLAIAGIAIALFTFNNDKGSNNPPTNSNTPSQNSNSTQNKP
ncbi:hypothetical protein IHV09_14380 [Fictibacillus sp. 23RED33]|uniref:hypothetical protein n=1 Tax=Fictibacillus sp. 23RED33 TaxID=2745879 RepID=UPI0018CDA812|nr:hypothetical protein [Fictibacillus sp. 23RED33]MBH0174751.1 hypothetical protein [Fictibacillus sp. 23RED33]